MPAGNRYFRSSAFSSTRTSIFKTPPPSRNFMLHYTGLPRRRSIHPDTSCHIPRISCRAPSPFLLKSLRAGRGFSAAEARKGRNMGWRLPLEKRQNILRSGNNPLGAGGSLSERQRVLTRPHPVLGLFSECVDILRFETSSRNPMPLPFRPQRIKIPVPARKFPIPFWPFLVYNRHSIKKRRCRYGL